MIKVTSPSVPSSASNKDTKRRRSNEMFKIRDTLSKGEISIQLKYELKSLTSVEREELMKEANFQVSIPPEQGLAMKADLCIPWKKLRLMRR